MLNEIKFFRDGRSPIPAKVATSKVMSANKAKDTRPEITLRKAIWKEGIRNYRLHPKALPGKPDIIFPSKKIAIFVNGCYWHRCPHCQPHMPITNTIFWSSKFIANIDRDKRINNQLINLGWDVIIVWECQVNKELAKQINLISKKFYE